MVSRNRPSQPLDRSAPVVPAIQVAIAAKWLRSRSTLPTPRTTATLPCANRLARRVSAGWKASPPDPSECAPAATVVARRSWA